MIQHLLMLNSFSTCQPRKKAYVDLPEVFGGRQQLILDDKSKNHLQN